VCFSHRVFSRSATPRTDAEKVSSIPYTEAFGCLRVAANRWLECLLPIVPGFPAVEKPIRRFLESPSFLTFFRLCAWWFIICEQRAPTQLP
jgi:hypothetical protein